MGQSGRIIEEKDCYPEIDNEIKKELVDYRKTIIRLWRKYELYLPSEKHLAEQLKIELEEIESQ